MWLWIIQAWPWLLRRIHSSKPNFAECLTLPSAALGKALFAECPTKDTRQRIQHSAKPAIPVVCHRVRSSCSDPITIRMEEMERSCMESETNCPVSLVLTSIIEPLSPPHFFR
jgi:hypothetical protein